jgi:hypothetical protein
MPADGLAFPGPANFWGCILTSNGVGNTSAILYSGRDANSALFLRLRALQFASLVVALPFPIEMPAGLYVALGANAAEAIIFYEPLFPAAPLS